LVSIGDVTYADLGFIADPIEFAGGCRIKAPHYPGDPRPIAFARLTSGDVIRRENLARSANPGEHSGVFAYGDLAQSCQPGGAVAMLAATGTANSFGITGFFQRQSCGEKIMPGGDLR
jgi:hypothetical protein